MNLDYFYLHYKYIAHRGLHDNAHGTPENSLKSIERALRKRVAIELDIRSLGDGTLVVFHDADLKRMCKKNKKLSHMTKSDLMNYVLENSTESIPTLEQVLELVRGRVPLLLEVKAESIDYKLLNQLIKQTDYYVEMSKGKVAFQSFNPFVVKWFLENAPTYPVGSLITNNYKDANIGFLKKRHCLHYSFQ